MSGNKTVPTMKDVAREAGVALGTVSKVVNGIPVGEEYRLRVESAIEKLNYRVSSYARGLRSSKTYTIAVMVPNLISPFFSRLVDCINRELSARKYRMLFYATDYDPAQEQELVHLAEQQKVDGIICLSYNPHLQVSPDVPLVSIDRYFGAQIPCVASDNYGGGGIYNSYTLSMTKHRYFRPVVVHEFGHSFGGLGDEYFYDDQYTQFYYPDAEPWEQNLTTLKDFGSKWADMVPKGTPIPTPATKKYAATVGAFEGGGYQSKGVYRPAQECRMKINDWPEFCPVCQRAIERLVEFYCPKK